MKKLLVSWYGGLRLFLLALMQAAKAQAFFRLVSSLVHKVDLRYKNNIIYKLELTGFKDSGGHF